MFGEVIGEVGRAGSPVYLELFLGDPVLYPVKSHVHGFRFLLFDLFVCKSVCG